MTKGTKGGNRIICKDMIREKRSEERKGKKDGTAGENKEK